MKVRAETGGVALPRFAWDAPYLVLTLYRTVDGAIRDSSPEAVLRDI